MSKSKTEEKVDSKNMRIVVSENGPYDVSGGIPLRIEEIVPNREGESWDWKRGKKFETEGSYSLCRCGHSSNKPFCDDTHLEIKFNGKETAGHVPYAKQAQTIAGPTLALADAERFCAFARFCDSGGSVWNLTEQSDNPDARALAIREANHCPSGRLVAYDIETRQPIEEKLEPAIGLIEDPAMGCSGPLWVQGGITIESADGKVYETRDRVTLCRCGASDNKPFCNGTHASIKFHDGLTKHGG